MGLSENVGSLATRIGQEIKAVRAEIVSALAGKANSSHTHSGTDVSSGTLSVARLPRVLYDIGTVGINNQALNLDASQTSAPLAADVTLNGNLTSLGAPTNPTNGQVLRLRFYAASADRTVTFHADIRTSTGLTRGAHTIPSGQVMIATLEYVSMISAWVLTAYTISAT